MQTFDAGKGKNESVLTNVLWKFSERITAQLVSTIVAIILARLLCPEDYGIVSIVTIFISIFNALVVGGLGNALIQKKDADELDFSSMFYFSVAFALVMYVIAFFVAELLANVYHNEELILVTRVMALRIPIAAINSIQHSYLARNMHFRKFFVSTLLGTVVSAFVGILLAYKGFGVWALVGQYMTNVCVDTIVLFLFGGWHPKWAFDWHRVKMMLPFGLKMMGSALLDTGFNELRSIVISLKYSATDLALYDNGKKYPNLLVVNINSSINAVMFPAMARVQDDKIALKASMQKAIKLSTYALTPLLLGMVAVAEGFVEVVLTEKWLECVPYIRITSIMCLFYPIHTVNIQALNAVGKSGYVLKLEIIKKAISIIALLVSMPFGVMGIALGAMAVSLLSTYINAVYSKQFVGYSFVEQMKDIGVALAMALIMCGCVYAIDCMIGMHNIFVLLAEVVVGALLYICLSIVLKVPEFYYLVTKARSLIKSIIH